MVWLLMLVAAGAWMAMAGTPDSWMPGDSFSYASSIVVQNPSGEQAHVSITYATPCDPTTPDFRFCGAKSPIGAGPYCAHHARVAYQPAQDRRRARDLKAPRFA